MAWLDFLRIPPASAYMPSLAEIPAAGKARATWAGLAQSPNGGALDESGFWSSAVWTVLTGEADLIDRTLTYEDFYRQQPWVFTVVNKLNRGIGRLPLKTYTLDSQGNRRRSRDGALAKLLRSPWPRATPSAFKQRLVLDMALYGFAIFRKIAKRPTDVPVSLEPLPPIGWRVLSDGRYELTSRRTGQVRTFEPWELLHFQFAGTGDPRGFAPSPLEPLKKTTAILDAAQRLGIAAFKHGGNTPGILTTDAKLAEVQKAADRIATQWAQKHGGVDNAYKTPVLTDGLKWMATGGTLADSAVVEHHRLGREEVCAVYDVPPPIVGILDRATFSNISEQARWLVQHTYSPWGTLIEETAEAQLIAEVPAFAGEFVEFDYAEILRGDLPSRYTAYAQAINAGFKTQNEIRRLENDPPMTDDPDAERLHRPGNLTPMLSAATSPSPAPAPNGAKE